MTTTAIFAFSICVLVAQQSAHASEWSEAQPIVRREGVVVSYRARLAGDTLVVEVKHAKGWHTYSMDNIERARRKTGKEKPDTELPTRIAVEGGLEVTGAWRQTRPKDLSQEDIFWYTWGFEDVALFATPVRRTEGEAATVTVNAQACNATSCSMVDGLQITLDLGPTEADPLGEDAFDHSDLVEVGVEK